MLIDNNVLYIKDFLINFANVFIHIRSCGVDIVIIVKYHSQFLKRKILSNTATFILPKFKGLVLFIEILLPNSCNFLPQLTLYVHLLIIQLPRSWYKTTQTIPSKYLDITSFAILQSSPMKAALLYWWATKQLLSPYVSAFIS